MSAHLLLLDLPPICLNNVLSYCSALKTLVRLETAFCSKQDSCREIILTGLNLLKEFDDSRHGQSWMHATRPVVVHKYLLWVVERNFTKITILSFNGSNDFDQKLWSILEANPQLFEHISHLHICNCNSDRVWTLVGRCPSLTELTLFNEPNVMLNPLNIAQVNAFALPVLRKLTILHVVLLEINSTEPVALFEMNISTLFMLFELCPKLVEATFTFPVSPWKHNNPQLRSKVKDIIASKNWANSVLSYQPQSTDKKHSEAIYGRVLIEFPPESAKQKMVSIYS